MDSPNCAKIVAITAVELYRRQSPDYRPYDSDVVDLLERMV